MFLDLIATDNQISCNVKAAKLLGLETAIYLNELINIYAKAIAKNKLDDRGYFKLKRSYITDRTTLSQQRQLELDINLLNTEIIERDVTDCDLMKVDIEMYASILTNSDTLLSTKVEKLAAKKSRAEKDAEKRRAITDALKASVACIMPLELRSAYYNWIDSVCEKPGGFLSKGAIKVFEDAITNYTRGDLDVALDLLAIATVKAYKDPTWVINTYERNKNQLRTTQNRVAGNVELSEISY